VSHYSSLEGRAKTHLPSDYWASHELCFSVHDVMLQLLISGQQARVFQTEFELHSEAEQVAFEADIFEWLDKYGGIEKRSAVLVTGAFPAVLGDALHCFYEALETSRKGKLTISYMLLRKPLQESLFVLETVIADRAGFANKLSYDPLKLSGQGAGGQAVHVRNIQKVLEAIGETDRFDANFLAQLRYDKNAADGFDGVCNKAIHLFTGHKAIKTEPLNINFIFTDWDEMVSQWSYLYSRLPYLLVYMRLIVEYICREIAPSDPAYVDDMDRRISALVLLWWETVKPPYREPRLEKFTVRTGERLHQHCVAHGFKAPDRADLIRMAESGAYPGESKLGVTQRHDGFRRAAERSSASTASLLTRLIRLLVPKRRI
jgi:hypothetical protein